MILQIFWNGGELFNDLVGTKDIATAISAVIFSGAGMALSVLANGVVPTTFKSEKISSPSRRISVGVICTWLFLRWFGGALAATNFVAFSMFAVGVGLLNYHLLSKVINIATKVVGKTADIESAPTDEKIDNEKPDEK